MAKKNSNTEIKQNIPKYYDIYYYTKDNSNNINTVSICAHSKKEAILFYYKANKNIIIKDIQESNLYK